MSGGFHRSMTILSFHLPSSSFTFVCSTFAVPSARASAGAKTSVNAKAQNATASARQARSLVVGREGCVMEVDAAGGSGLRATGLPGAGYASWDAEALHVPPAEMVAASGAHVGVAEEVAAAPEPVAAVAIGVVCVVVAAITRAPLAATRTALPAEAGQPLRAYGVDPDAMGAAIRRGQPTGSVLFERPRCSAGLFDAFAVVVAQVRIAAGIALDHRTNGGARRLVECRVAPLPLLTVGVLLARCASRSAAGG